MLHIKRFQLAGKLTGTSPIGVAAQGIGLGLSSERFGARYFVDSAAPSSVLESDINIPPDNAKGIIQNWIATHGGRRYPAILSGGLKYRQITISPNEAQFLETRQFQRSEIAMLFGIPPHMIGDVERSTSWGTGIEQQSTGFLIYNLRPWLVCLEHAFNRLTPRGQFCLFDADALLRGDAKTRWESYEAGRRAGALSVNDILRKEAMPLIGPEGDMRLQPMNYVPLGTKPDEYPAVLAAEAAQGIDPDTGRPYVGMPTSPPPQAPANSPNSNGSGRVPV
jgi:HK97 family phage portal protein